MYGKKVDNPNFNYGGYAVIRNQAGLNTYEISVQKWQAQTNAVGIVARVGRYGGSYF